MFSQSFLESDVESTASSPRGGRPSSSHTPPQCDNASNSPLLVLYTVLPSCTHISFLLYNVQGLSLFFFLHPCHRSLSSPGTWELKQCLWVPLPHLLNPVAPHGPLGPLTPSLRNYMLWIKNLNSVLSALNLTRYRITYTLKKSLFA